MKHCPRRMKPVFWMVVGLAAVITGLWIVQDTAAQARQDEDAYGGQQQPHDDNPLANVPFEARLNLAKAYQSPVGQMLLRHIRQEKPNIDELMDGLVETIGLDPRTAVGELVFSGAGMNEMDLQLVADLGESTGNLEGFMLTLPGYQSADLDDQTLLHSFHVDDNPQHQHDADDVEPDHQGKDAHRVWVALPKNNTGRYHLIASFDQHTTKDIAQRVLAGEQVASAELQGDDVLKLRVDDLDEHGLPQGAPGSAVLESVQTLSLTIGSGEDVTGKVHMTTSSPARARQVSQLLQGLIALGQLAALEAPEAQPLADFLNHVQVVRLEEGDASAVTLNFEGSHEKVEEWIEFIMENAH